MGADPVTASLLVGGAAIEIYGNYEANKAQAKAERMNAAAYAEQKRMSEMAARREADLQMADGIAFVGEQISAFTKAGINIDGSALMQIARTEAAIQREQSAILLGAQYKSKLFDMQAQQSLKTAATLSSGKYNFMQSAGIAMNTGANIALLKSKNGNSDSEVTIASGGGNLTDRGFDVKRGNLQYGSKGKA